MRIKRILQNPLQSFQKEFRRVNNKWFAYSYGKKIEAALKGKSPDIDLEKLYPDRRNECPSNIEKIKHIAVKILSMIDHLSKTYDFKYMLSYGSLLGAIRHDGFIPWDDDLDIMMMRRDLDRLIEVCHNFPASIKVFPMQHKFIKVMDKYSKISFDGQRGVAIDIFVIEDEGEKYSFVNSHTAKKIQFSEKDIFPLKKHQFENQQFCIPNNFDKILTAIYGDYMVPPPPEKRVFTHVNDDSIRIFDYPNPA